MATGLQVLEAARLATSRGQAESAARLLARALEEPPEPGARTEILAELGRLESSLGRVEAADRLTAAVDLTPPGPGSTPTSAGP